jgi:hypothetical protein
MYSGDHALGMSAAGDQQLTGDRTPGLLAVDAWLLIHVAIGYTLLLLKAVVTVDM